MRCFVVHKITCFLNQARIESFHYNMFHGLSARNSVEDPNHKNYMLGDALDAPLQVIKNVYDIADVFCPSINFVVSAQTLAELKKLAQIQFLKIAFRRLVSYPYFAGDFAFEKDPRYCALPVSGRAKAFLQMLPEAQIEIGNYYELIAGRLLDVQEKFKDLNKVTYSLKNVDGDVREVALSSALFRTYPIIWHRDFFFSEGSFQLMAPHLNKDYFYVQPIEVR